MLKYLHESGCTWDKRTFMKAAGKGHLDMLMYLRENGCPWDAMTWNFAKDESIRVWLEENGCPQENDYQWYSDDYSDDEEFDN